MKLLVHRFENEKWGRYHLPWMKLFSEYLSQKGFEIEVVNYNKDGKTFDGKIDIRCNTKNFFSGLGDTDCLVENLSNQEFFVVSFAKNFSSRVIHYLKYDNCIGIFLAHFSRRYLFDHLDRSRYLHAIHKVHPFIFGFFQDFDVDQCRSLRDSAEELNSKLFFKGSAWRGGDRAYRKTIGVLHDKKFLNANNVPIHEYHKQLSLQEIALSHYLDLDKFLSAFENPGELCYRDMEMMAIGVPYIRLEYKSEIHNAFIPNYHYIVVPREEAFERFRSKGHEGVADLYIQTYNRYKDKKDFLKFISQNQRDWYDQNFRWPQSANIIYNKLKLEKWKT
jgi:hypothetical protein